MTTTFRILIDITGDPGEVDVLVRQMRAGLREDVIDLREVASIGGYSMLERIYDFDRRVAAARHEDLDSHVVRIWNRPSKHRGEPSRSFEFVGHSSPLIAINDLSKEHHNLRFNFSISLTSERGDELLAASGAFIDGMWES